MNFFIAYGVVVFMVATISTANRVKEALEGATDVVIGYSLEVQVRAEGGGRQTEQIHGSIAVSVSTQTVVEYSNRVGFIVTTSELLQRLDVDETEDLPNLGSENVLKLKSIDSVKVTGNTSTTHSQNLFEGSLSYAKNIYLIDVSGIEGAIAFETYNFEATHKVRKEKPICATTTIVRYDGKSYAEIYFPNPEMYTFKLVSQIKGADKFPTSIEGLTSTGLITIKMAAG